MPFDMAMRIIEAVAATGVLDKIRDDPVFAAFAFWSAIFAAFVVYPMLLLGFAMLDRE